MSFNRETGKDRWNRVPKDYYKHRDPIPTWKILLSTGALVLSLAWLSSGVDWARPTSWKATDRNSLRANHGTLTRAHSLWDSQCDACHIPFEPIDGRALFSSVSSPSSRSSDKLCMSCHAGPDHHDSTIDAEVRSCAECHRDHQGRDFSLVRLGDNECTRCHQSLEKHIDPKRKKKEGREAFVDSVTAFNESGHPPFGPEAAELVSKDGESLKDRSKLKFNHARHMSPGIVKNPGDSPYTYEQIPVNEERPRYQKWARSTDAVQLDCSSCHQLDSTEIGASAPPTMATSGFPSRSPGRYYLPITFQNECRGCHVLSFDPSRKNLEVPHGVQPDQVREFLRQSQTAQVLLADPAILEGYTPTSRLPGKSPISVTARKRLDEAVSREMRFMFPDDSTGSQHQNANNCMECHYYSKDRIEGYPVRVEPTRVPEVWFTHASFNHTAHRGVSCRDCHSGAYAMSEDGKSLNPRASSSNVDYLIPGISNCVQCHAPASSQGWFGTSPAPVKGGASFDCTECHRYHNGDQTLQGPGASVQNAGAERSIRQFLEARSGRDRKMPGQKSPHP